MRLTVAQASELLSTNKQFVRIALQRQVLPIGVAVKMSSKWTYLIESKKVADYIGVEEEELLEKLGKEV